MGGLAMNEIQAHRRRHERISSEIPARISTIEPERDPWTGRPFFRASQERCLNLSRGGAFVRTTEPLAPGRRLLVEIHLPNGTHLEAIAKVAWTKTVMSSQARDAGGGIGIEFLGGDASEFAALSHYIEENAESTIDENVESASPAKSD